MKKIILVFLVIVLTFICCNLEDLAVTERTSCKNNVDTNQNALDPESCVSILGATSSSERRAVTDNQKENYKFLSNLFLIQCLNYTLAMSKCEKKSNILPP